MTYNGWQNPGPHRPVAQAPGNWAPQEVELPHQLQGPFIREFVPQSAYKHRGAQLASVLFHRNGGHSVLTVRGAQHHNKPLMGKPTSVCLIARGRHQTSFRMELPTLGDQAAFGCEVDVNWEVQDFALVAEKRVVDVERMLRPPLLARLRTITRRNRLEEAQAADEAIQAELTGGQWSSFGAEIGLLTEVFVRVDLGAAAADHKLNLVQVQHNATVQSELDKAAAARVEANLPAAKALIEAGEAAHYQHLLAQDPSRAVDVLGALQIQAKEQRQGALEYLTRLIDQGVVQRHQVEGQVQMLIDYAKAVGGSAFAGGLLPAATSLPIPGPAANGTTNGAANGLAGTAGTGGTDGGWALQPPAPAAEIPPLPPLPPPPATAPYISGTTAAPADAPSANGAAPQDSPALPAEEREPKDE